jgi:hypothetical protein
MKCTTNLANLLALTATSLCLAGWAAQPKGVTLPPVGPNPGTSTANLTEGSLQVYSARHRAQVDANREEFFWNNDFGKNDFLYEPAHTDYTIYGGDGEVF